MAGITGNTNVSVKRSVAMVGAGAEGAGTAEEEEVEARVQFKGNTRKKASHSARDNSGATGEEMEAANRKNRYEKEESCKQRVA